MVTLFLFGQSYIIPSENEAAFAQDAPETNARISQLVNFDSKDNEPMDRLQTSDPLLSWGDPTIEVATIDSLIPSAEEGEENAVGNGSDAMSPTEKCFNFDAPLQRADADDELRLTSSNGNFAEVENSSSLDEPTHTMSSNTSQYEEELQKRFRLGEQLNVDELFELRAFAKRQQGGVLCDDETKELSRLQAQRLQREVARDDIERKISSEHASSELLVERRVGVVPLGLVDQDNHSSTSNDYLSKVRLSEEICEEKSTMGDGCDSIKEDDNPIGLEEGIEAEEVIDRRTIEQTDVKGLLNDDANQVDTIDGNARTADVLTDFLEENASQVLQSLGFTAEERKEIELEAKKIAEILRRREAGEVIDEDMLYEIKLFHRQRKRESLTSDDLAELKLFEKRKDAGFLQEDELDALAALRRKRLAKEVSPDIEEQSDDEDGDLLYMKNQRRRLQRGERLRRDDLVELDLLERQHRGEALSSEEYDELNLLRNERHKMESSQVFQTWHMEIDPYEDDEESSVTPQKPRKSKKEKKRRAKKERITKPPNPPKPRKDESIKKPKEKRMRRKKKPHALQEAAPGVATNPEMNGNATNEDVKDDTLQEIPSEPTAAPIATPQVRIQEPAKTGFFGRFVGKSKKELELEEMKRRQEELIKEQLKAMQMEEEIQAMEKEREMQETLVQEAIESKSRADVSVSSWETDTSYEESEDELIAQSSEDEVSTGDNSSISGSDSSSYCSSSSGSTSASSKSALSGQQSIGRKSGLTAESKSLVTTESVDILSMSCQKQSLSRDTSASKDSVSRASSILTGSVALDKSTEESSRSASLTLPPKQITTHKSEEVANNTDGVSVVSDGSFLERQDSAPKQGSEGAAASSSRARADRRRSRARASDPVTKSGLLSAHLRRQRREQRRRDREKNVSRYGDEISLGTAGMKQTVQESVSSNGLVNQESYGVSDKHTNADPSKPSRPWKDTVLDGSLNRQITPREEEPVHQDSQSKKVDFFHENKEMLGRSIFNFSHASISSKMSETSGQENSDSLSVVPEDEQAVIVTEYDSEIENNRVSEQETRNDMMEEEGINSLNSMNYEAEQSFSLLGYGGIESKLASKKQNKEEEFNEAWETIEADRAVAAQMNQKRMMRLRDRAPAREEKKDEGLVEVPRLFLFEGEKVERRKKSKKKERKKVKKLNSTLSKEFRKAMHEVFNSESEDEYDRNFGEHDEEKPRKNGSGRALRRGSNESMYDSVSHSSASELSAEEEKGQEEEFDDDYLRRLREKSMQQEVKEMLYEKRSEVESAESDEGSDASDVSRDHRKRDKSTSGTSVSSSRNHGTHKNRKEPRKNRSGELVYEGIDPADVYAQELEKQKVRKTFTVSDLKKEMEEMKQEAAAANFEDAFAGMATSGRLGFSSTNGKLGFAEPQTPQPGMKSKRGMKGKSPMPSGPGINSLRALNMSARPGLGREASFTTQHSNIGLLGGGRKAFASQNKSNFAIGGTLASAPIAEDDDDEAFLTGGGASPGTQASASVSRGLFGSMMSGFASHLVSPGPGPGKMKPSFRRGGFGGAQKQSHSQGLASSQLGNLGGDESVGVIGSLGGFQEPLPVPDMQEDAQSSKRMFGIGKIAGKVKMSVKGLGFSRRKQSSQDFGGMLADDDDDEMEGGLLG